MKRTGVVIGVVVAMFLLSLTFSFFTVRMLQGRQMKGVKTASETDPQLAVAEQTAKNTLDPFLTKLKAGTVQGAVKVEFNSPVGPEYIWVDHLQFLPNDNFSGKLANQPKLLTGKKKGDEVTFAKADIVDWISQNPDGTQDGDFTGEVLRREGG